MKTLTSPVTTEIAATQSGWCELCDIYLKSAITTPFGTTDTLRLTTLPGGLSFFTPKISPEPAGTQGNAQSYSFWPLKREIIKGSSKFANDKLGVAASNVTAEWAQMLADVDWYDVPIVIRKVSTTIASPTADDCAVIFSGLVDSAKITNEQITFVCSNDMGTFDVIKPAESMHPNCRFQWADDRCTAIRFLTENYKSKTCGTGSTTTIIKSAGLTEDAALRSQAVTVDSTTDKVSLTAHGLSDGDEVMFSATALPGGLSAWTWYFVVSSTANDFVVSSTYGGAAIDITSNGTAVAITTYGHDLINPLADANFTASSNDGTHTAKQVKNANQSEWWGWTGTDWGTATQGVWQIPDAQAGLKNAALTPYIQIDFGAAKKPTVWRIAGVGSLAAPSRAFLPRLILFFSSTDAATWTFETYFEMPPLNVTHFDVLIPKASNARYWRICQRTRWAETNNNSPFWKIKAYEAARNWWASGQIKFDAATATVALRNVTRTIIDSFNGDVSVGALPAAPANGDTFVIERGCTGSFNACAERRNTENFGGFDSLPFETVIR